MTGAESRSGLVCQLDPAWLEWMTRKQDRLGTFFTHDAPAMPKDKYSSEALRVAERTLLECFPTGRVVGSGNAVLIRFACYLGEVFVQSLNAYWHNDPFPYATPRATVRFEYTDVQLDVYDQVVLALHYRTGARWHDLHTTLSDRCADWWESGRNAR
jgi:hypothetical protein